MKAGFYPKLAVTGIRKNKRLYIPYILTCTGMIIMQYIITFLSQTPALADLPRGSSSVKIVLGLGVWVMFIFSAIFIFYTNSFLIRRRKKEFGLYNILGMDKLNIGRILFWESVTVALVSLVAGLGIGIILSKLAELGLMNVINHEISYDFSISVNAIADTALLFTGVFALVLIKNFASLRVSDPMRLFNSESTGEKPPKVNWFIGLLGVILLVAAYYIAVSIKDPLSALEWFFVAVVMVIVATYMLFVAGSVVLCKILQKKKKYYYKPNHFISVSSMAYRMKRNGAGLASICILGTMVLVMIASSACLYIGQEDALRARYPRDIIIQTTYTDTEYMNDELIGPVRGAMTEIIAAYNAEPKNMIDYRYASKTGIMEDGVFDPNERTSDSYMETYSNVYQAYVISLEDYNKAMGENAQLACDETMIYTNRNAYLNDEFTIKNGKTYRVTKILDELVITGNAAMDIIPSVFIIVSDFEDVVKQLKDVSDSMWISLCWEFGFDTNISDELQLDLLRELRKAAEAYEFYDTNGVYSFYSANLAANRAEIREIFGGLFYLGICLSIVFIFAAVLIIYYKQISEGYEDQARFEIMQKVGMTKKDIKKSINSQMLTVFLLPLVMAGAHLAFAFPMLNKLLMMFNLHNTNLLIATAAASFLVFALFYVLVYRITSKAYFNIVSGAKEQ